MDSLFGAKASNNYSFAGIKSTASCLRCPEGAVVKSQLCSLKTGQVVENVAHSGRDGCLKLMKFMKLTLVKQRQKELGKMWGGWEDKEGKGCHQ